ncbi:phosphoenolpyruvate synthase [Parachryseolinea silvisoli]|uniref:phosphoenolpyruvate synthase n=1 Tax=Parachryseolinea silvisoli TaxID=2873601 RepID=UPI002265B2FA|nr:phosphoenolpyruvate synthase [Parachryseolinea silvisoli]MCD9014224.1 phosphoenolpyruvate synthase [Parachryseolinea silvisoli]
MIGGRSFVLSLQDCDRTKLAIVGGKGANLGELAKIGGVLVPDGFCITTAAFTRALGENSTIRVLLNRLSTFGAADVEKIREVSGEIRRIVEGIVIPRDICEEVTRFLSRFDAKEAFAVRSSATAEDLPTASFAGQQDTYLNVIGVEAILQHISKCWASLFTARAVLYRVQHDFDHRKVRLSVVVQKMVFPQVAGIMFTADPVTGNRKVISIDASFGLGEALVSGLVNADVYKVRDGQVIEKKISAKKLAIYAIKEGGTKTQEIEAARQNMPALTDGQIVQLAHLGSGIEQHFGYPQDIEWCLADGRIYIVQSRPITTLFPIPQENDRENHVYISVGHQQMMTDAMKPLGLSVRQLTSAGPMAIAGGRMFVDVAARLSSPATRKTILEMAGQSDPLIKDALMTVLERNDFIKLLPGDEPGNGGRVLSMAGFRTQLKNDPAIAAGLVARSQASIKALRENIQSKSGSELLDLILEDLAQLKTSLFDSQNMAAIMGAMDAAAWINEKMNEWLGEINVADTLSQSVPNNVTSEMGLALLDVADVIRPYPAVIEYLQQVKDKNFLDELVNVEGGEKARKAIDAYLEMYGMRCTGEIDITRTRWSEDPRILVPLILSNIRNFEPHASQRKFEQGRQEALKKETELLNRLKQLPDGEQKAEETKRMISLVRNFAGYREYPKYDIVSRYFVYKQALLREAEALVQANVIHSTEDIDYLTFEELHEVVRRHALDYQIIRKRKDDYELYKKLTPPRVITSEGEIITGTYKRGNLPTGAIIGLAVSSGIVEGRARVIVKMEDAVLEEGDILVTPFTDPSWTPLFLSIKGLITEVGGLMTHGAVIAREYGLPAVVGVERATTLIRDGQRIRVHGTEGYVEILKSE